MMGLTASPVAGLVDLNPSPFGQLAQNKFSGCCDRDLVVSKARAAPGHNQIEKLPVKTGIDRKCLLWMQQSILGICWMSLS